MKIALTYIL